jgi:hypothetical protein
MTERITKTDKEPVMRLKVGVFMFSNALPSVKTSRRRRNGVAQEIKINN